jgi:hypothetical protein
MSEFIETLNGLALCSKCKTINVRSPNINFESYVCLNCNSLCIHDKHITISNNLGINSVIELIKFEDVQKWIESNLSGKFTHFENERGGYLFAEIKDWNGQHSLSQLIEQLTTNNDFKNYLIAQKNAKTYRP